ncbi:MAG: replication factor [Thermococcaceae archaeon]|nr:replication factor [Thermococcaceae archaeon]MDK2913493.1 replication factor [Thermococcaceae archaeon]
MDIIKLRELLENELSSPYLTELDDEFYKEFDSLVKALKLGAETSRERGEDVEERLYLAQLTIAEKLMKEIIKVRLHKIVDLAVDGVPGDMSPEERRIFHILRAFIEREELSLPENIQELEIPDTATAEDTSKRVPVREAYIILVDLPRIMGVDMREYGPFHQGDLAVIPPEIGRVLLERNAAIKIRLGG